MIGEYLLAHGYEVVPVNPNHEQVLGLKCYPSLTEAAGKFDVVNVFRRSEYCEAVVKDAIATGAKGIWLQSGIRNERAKQKAMKAGIDFVQDRCIMVEHRYGGGRGAESGCSFRIGLAGMRVNVRACQHVCCTSRCACSRLGRPGQCVWVGRHYGGDAARRHRCFAMPKTGLLTSAIFSQRAWDSCRWRCRSRSQRWCLGWRWGCRFFMTSRRW